MKTVFRTKVAGYNILLMAGPHNFTVVYGRQIDQNLTYAQAAAKLGEAIMHGLQCEGKLDGVKS